MDPNENNDEPTQFDDDKVPVNTNKTRKVTKNVTEAMTLPVCMNLNPRSIYNKVDECITFVKEHDISCIFLSESWERPEFNLNQLINIEDFSVVSNPHQRVGVGGRPALVINTKQYYVRNLTNSLIDIPWGCEATWAIITQKNSILVAIF